MCRCWLQQFQLPERTKQASMAPLPHRSPGDLAAVATVYTWPGRAGILVKTPHFICSEHFTPDSYEHDLWEHLLGNECKKTMS